MLQAALPTTSEAEINLLLKANITLLMCEPRELPAGVETQFYTFVVCKSNTQVDERKLNVCPGVKHKVFDDVARNLREMRLFKGDAKMEPSVVLGCRAM